MSPASPATETWALFLRATGYKPKTVQTYLEAMANLSLSIPVPEEATRLELLRWLDGLRTTVSPASASVRLRSVRRFYKWLVTEGIRPDDPTSGMTVRVPEKVLEVPTAADIEAMVAACPRTKHGRRDAAIIRLLADTGLRRGEAAGLTRADVDLTTKVVIVRNSKSEPRWVPVSDAAALALSRWLRSHSGTTSNLWDVGNPSATIQRALTRRSKGRWTAHSLRRYFAWRYLTAGGSVPALMHLAGWRDSTMPNRYVRGAARSLAETEYRRLFA